MLKNAKSYIIITCFPFIFALIFFVNAQAVVSGKDCNKCHTMHNSQNGAQVNANGTQEFLLNVGGGGKTTCWGCHAQGGANNVDSITGAPQVKHTNATDLAGGNFRYIVDAATSNLGHNVKDTAINDGLGIGAPPGDQHGNSFNNDLTCSGAKGCHGDRNIVTSEGVAIKGAHHYNDSALKFGAISEANQAKTTGSTGDKVGSSYRFLMGVKGGEDPDWQKTTSATDHNEYKGATSMGNSSKTSPINNTISGLCAECHGNFHGDGSTSGTGTASPWLRHPTDISLPSTGEYAAYTSYNLTVPVARTVIPNSANGTVTPSGSSDDIIMCLSCHSAHASPNYKIMRWNIKSGTLTTAISGCNVCHTSKN